MELKKTFEVYVPMLHRWMLCDGIIYELYIIRLQVGQA